jgi:hypothetical protein
MLAQVGLDAMERLAQKADHRRREADRMFGRHPPEQAIEDRLERPDGHGVEDGDEKETGNGEDDPSPIWAGVSEEPYELLSGSLHASNTVHGSGFTVDRP